MSLFRKPKRKFRQRVVKFESDDEDGESGANESTEKRIEKTAPTIPLITASPAGTASDGSDDKISSILTSNPSKDRNGTSKPSSKDKKTKEKPQRTSVLSFEQEEEDDGEVFKVKKSSQSRRLAKMLEKERKQKQKEKLPATKDNDGDEEQRIKAGLEMVFIKAPTDLIEKPTAKQAPKCEEYVEIVAGDSEEEDDENEDGHPLSSKDPFRTILESGAIPDAAMIHAARKRRQMAREMGDYVAIDSNSEQHKESESRLVRDDDNDRSDEEEEEGGRLSFIVNTAARDREKVREAIMSASQPRATESGDEDVDEELERWEQEQIRKGVSIPQITNQPVVQLQQEQQQHENHYYTQSYYTGPQGVAMGSVSVPTGSVADRVEMEEKNRTAAAPPPNLDKSVPTLEMVRQRLQERFLSLNDVHRAHSREVEKVSYSLDTSEQRVLHLEKEVPRLYRSFSFYQETRGYVTDLVECLDQKIVQINELELAMRNLLKNRTARLIGRRQQDIKDQSEEFAKLSCKVMASQAADMQGRDKAVAEDTAKMRRVAEREGRRSRRRRARETKISAVKHYEGMSSDDEELEADVTMFLAERDRILRETTTVFEDVIDEFSSLGHIKEHFEEWKKRYSDSYNEAYIGFCLPKLFNPFIRLQLISWDPFKGKTFENMNWYETLIFYGYEEGASLDSVRRDSDVNLVPMIIERIIVPRINDMVDDVWDPMSTSQTLRLVTLIKKLVDEYPSVTGGSKKLTALLQSIVSRLKKTLDDDVYVPLYPKALLENTSIGANAFFQRQFWCCMKLLHNILSWQGILSDSFLQELSLDRLLNRYILLALQTWPGGYDADKCRMITSVLPRTWFSQLSGERTLPQLEMFCRYLKMAASNLEKNSPGFTAGFHIPKADPKESLKEIIKILATIRAMDHALSLANQFSLKDLKSLVMASN